MSPKQCSLALDEATELTEDNSFEPKLSVLIPKERGYSRGFSVIDLDNVVRVTGKITVSF